MGLLGPNGAGKTTTFYMVVGLIKPDEGQVFLNTEDITKLPMYKRAQMGIGYLPQEASVFRKLSVEDNILAVLEMTKLSKKDRLDKLEQLLEEFNLNHVRKNNGDSLSGGERRRTEIARALAVDPKFILLDEPFAGVDPIAVEDIQTVVARLKYKNIGILITDHNVNETLSICDRAYLLIEGKIFKHGTAEELAENEQVRRLYLGTNFELKRKDWIIELAKKGKAENDDVNPNDESTNKKIKTATLISFLEYQLQSIEKLSKLLESFGMFEEPFKMASDLNVKECFFSLEEARQSLLKKAEEVKSESLEKIALDLPVIKYEDYHKIFEMRDYSTVAGGGILKSGINLFYKPMISKLKDDLYIIKPLLGRAIFELKAFSD